MKRAKLCIKCMRRPVPEGHRSLCDLCQEKQKRAKPIGKAIAPTDLFGVHVANAIRHVEAAISDFAAARAVRKVDAVEFAGRYLGTLLHYLLKEAK